MPETVDLIELISKLIKQENEKDTTSETLVKSG